MATTCDHHDLCHDPLMIPLSWDSNIPPIQEERGERGGRIIIMSHNCYLSYLWKVVIV